MYLLLIFINRYNRHDKRSKFPPWINQFLKEDHCLNLSTDIAVEKMKVFLRQMGQGIDREALHSILMDEDQVLGRKKQKVGEFDSVTSNTSFSASNLSTQVNFQSPSKTQEHNQNLNENTNQENNMEIISSSSTITTSVALESTTETINNIENIESKG